MGLPTATVRLRGPDGQESIGIGMGTGPVDAAYKAIDSIVKVQVGQQAPSLTLCGNLWSHSEGVNNLYGFVAQGGSQGLCLALVFCSWVWRLGAVAVALSASLDGGVFLLRNLDA